MTQREREITIEGAQSFRELVGGLLKESSLFQTNPPRATLGREYTQAEKLAIEKDRLGILEAIENNDVSAYIDEYFGGRPSDRVLDAVECLIHVYDELKKEEPDKDFIASTVEQLKEYL